MGTPVTQPIKLVALLVKRSTGELAAKNIIKNRAWRLIVIKLGLWLSTLADAYPPEEYRLVVSLDGDDEDERVKKLKEWFRKKGITILEETIEKAK